MEFLRILYSSESVVFEDFRELITKERKNPKKLETRSQNSLELLNSSPGPENGIP